MKKMFVLMIALVLALVTVPAFAGAPSDNYTLDSASFAGVMGISAGEGTGTGNTIAEATNTATAGPITVNNSTHTATTNATTNGTSSYTVGSNGSAMAIQFGAALASYSNNSGTVTGSFNPLTAGSVATFGVTW